MKNFITIVITTLLLYSCGSQGESLSKEDLEKNYNKKERSINLSNTGIKGFVFLNDVKPDKEIGNLYLSENEIEILDISEYKNLGKVELQNNKISFFSDVRYPEKIRQLDLSFNALQSLDGIENLTELQTLNVSYNKLDEEDFQRIAGLSKLRLVYADGNDVSEEFLQRLAQFNSKYLSTIKQ